MRSFVQRMVITGIDDYRLALTGGAGGLRPSPKGLWEGRLKDTG